MDSSQNSHLAGLDSSTDKKNKGEAAPDRHGENSSRMPALQPAVTPEQPPREYAIRTRLRPGSPVPSHPSSPHPPSPGHPTTPSRSGRKHSASSLKIDSMAIFVAPVPDSCSHDVKKSNQHQYNTNQ